MRALGLLLALAATLGFASAAQACSCAFQSPAKQLKGADGAVVARQLAVRPVPGEAEVDFVYRVGRVVKGAPGLRRGRRISVRTSLGDSVCGLSRDIGGLTGLFLYREAGVWTSGSCAQVSARQMRRAGGARVAASAAGCGG